jgi:hypothetical protein
MGVMVFIFGRYLWRSMLIVCGYIEMPNKQLFWKKYIMMFEDLNYRRMDPTMHLYWICFRSLLRCSFSFCMAMFESYEVIQYIATISLLVLQMFIMLFVIKPYDTKWKYIGELLLASLMTTVIASKFVMNRIVGRKNVPKWMLSMEYGLLVSLMFVNITFMLIYALIRPVRALVRKITAKRDMYEDIDLIN